MYTSQNLLAEFSKFWISVTFSFKSLGYRKSIHVSSTCSWYSVICWATSYCFFLKEKKKGLVSTIEWRRVRWMEKGQTFLGTTMQKSTYVSCWWGLKWIGVYFIRFLVGDCNFSLTWQFCLIFVPVFVWVAQTIKEIWSSILKYPTTNATLPTHPDYLLQTWQHMLLVEAFSSSTHHSSCSSDNMQLEVGENLNAIQVGNNIF